MLKVATAAAFAAFLLSPAQAAMIPAAPAASASVIHVDCAVGFHLGPAGACLIGNEERHDKVIEEHRATDEGCQTRTVKRTNDEGDSVTHSTTNCN